VLKPKALVLRAPGTNCDEETQFAFEMAGVDADRIHINRIIESPNVLDEYQILCVPGGFSFGDDIAAGRILANQILNRLRDAVEDFRAADKLVLGICNGFQVLVKTGFIVPPDNDGLCATLTWNDSGRFIDRWVKLKTAGEQCVFLKGLDEIYLPIAHAEGKFVARDENILNELESAGQLALRYHSNGTSENPNGSSRDIAGVCDASGRVFGLMPHPERHVLATQHPRWTREGLNDCPDGRGIFDNAASYFA
jgi:phosphoribosylformylglycinamidine synthase